MKLKQFRVSITKPIPSIFPFPFSFAPFCTSNHTRSSHSFDDVVPGSSAVYRHALKFQRPVTIEWSPHLENTASFIGSVTREPKRINTKSGNFGVHTTLKVRRFNQPNSFSFGVLLMMWNCLGEFASKHLKPNDFIYVSGRLGSYTKADASGSLQLNYQILREEGCSTFTHFHWTRGKNVLFREHLKISRTYITNYKLFVKELDFVDQRLGHQGHVKLESIEAEAGIQQNDQNRLHLWQVFFANPNEWWDQRKSKLNPKQPDFKHKDTGETLWLSKYDPPWVKKQLEMFDSKIAGGGLVGHRSRRVTTWVYDE